MYLTCTYWYENNEILVHPVYIGIYKYILVNSSTFQNILFIHLFGSLLFGIRLQVA